MYTHPERPSSDTTILVYQNMRFVAVYAKTDNAKTDKKQIVSIKVLVKNKPPKTVVYLKGKPPSKQALKQVCIAYIKATRIMDRKRFGHITIVVKRELAGFGESFSDPRWTVGIRNDPKHASRHVKLAAGTNFSVLFDRKYSLWSKWIIDLAELLSRSDKNNTEQDKFLTEYESLAGAFALKNLQET